MSADAVVDAVGASRLVAILRTRTSELAVEGGARLLEAGVRCVEVSLVTPDGLDAVARLVGSRPAGTFVGAGTVLSPAEVDATAEAGGTFVVSPVFDPAVVARTKELGLASFPGVATPTEAVAAVRAGADAVKLFPASAWTPAVLADVLAALPWLRTVPTGGVTADAAPAWIAAGAWAVGLGSTLGTLLAEGGRDRVAALLEDLRRAAPASD